MALITLCVFAFLAGFVDAVVGGGGLIQLPAFFILQPQLALAQILATNKTASFSGTLVSAIRYLRRVRIDWKHLAPAIGAALCGAFGGALLISFVHKEQFMPFIICVLIFVLIYTLFKRELGLYHIDKQISNRKTFIFSVLIGGIIGFYDGLIGPGTGSFLIFAYVVIFGYDFLKASANAKLVNCVTNIAALSFFLAKGFIVWPVAIPVAAANMAGSYAGSHIALKKGSAFVRILFIVVVIALIAKLSYDYL